MARDLKGLLSKKGWTGEEVGKALIASLVNDIKHLGQTYEPLFTQDDLTRMVKNLQTDRDRNVFNFYQNIHTGIVEAYNRGQAQHQQFYNGFYRLLLNLRQCQTAEEALKIEDESPLVMTQSQYDRYYKEAEEKMAGYTDSFIGVMFSLIEYFINNEDEAPEDIKKAIEATKEEPVTNPNILSSYNRTYGLGYYTLPDGRRSDEMELDEWGEALKELYLKHHKYKVNGVTQDYEETISHFNTQRLIKAYKMFYYGIDSVKEAYKNYYGEEMAEEEEQDYFNALKRFLSFPEMEQIFDRRKKAESPLFNLDSEIIELIDGNLRGYQTEWNYYEEPPADLTKYDLLEDVREVYSFYAVENIEEIQPFIDDYPELYKVLEAYIKKNIPQLKKLKPADYVKDNSISWVTLAELNIADYKRLCSVDDDDIRQLFFKENEDDIQLYKMRAKSHANGIAILKNPKSWQVDESGDFKETHKRKALFRGIDIIDSTLHTELEICLNSLLKPSIAYILSYNALMDILAETYSIADLEEAKLSTLQFESQIDAYNNLFFMYYSEVYGTEEERERKRKLIKENFSPIDIEELKPTEEAKDKLKAELDKIAKSKGSNDKLKDFDYFISVLSERGL